MCAEFDFAESTLSNVLANYVVSNRPRLLLLGCSRFTLQHLGVSKLVSGRRLVFGSLGRGNLILNLLLGLSLLSPVRIVK